jgi:hypothetical protein
MGELDVVHPLPASLLQGLFSSKHKPHPGPGRLRLNSSRLLQLVRDAKVANR